MKLSTYTAQNLGADRLKRVGEGFIATNKLIVMFGIGFFIALNFYAADTRAFTIANWLISYLHYRKTDLRVS